MVLLQIIAGTTAPKQNVQRPSTWALVRAVRHYTHMHSIEEDRNPRVKAVAKLVSQVGALLLQAYVSDTASPGSLSVYRTGQHTNVPDSARAMAAT